MGRPWWTWLLDWAMAGIPCLPWPYVLASASLLKDLMEDLKQGWGTRRLPPIYWYIYCIVYECPWITTKPSNFEAAVNMFGSDFCEGAEEVALRGTRNWTTCSGVIRGLTKMPPWNWRRFGSSLGWPSRCSPDLHGMILPHTTSPAQVLVLNFITVVVVVTTTHHH